MKLLLYWLFYLTLACGKPPKHNTFDLAILSEAYHGALDLATPRKYNSENVFLFARNWRNVGRTKRSAEKSKKETDNKTPSAEKQTVSDARSQDNVESTDMVAAGQTPSLTYSAPNFKSGGSDLSLSSFLSSSVDTASSINALSASLASSFGNLGSTLGLNSLSLPSQNSYSFIPEFSLPLSSQPPLISFPSSNLYNSFPLSTGLDFSSQILNNVPGLGINNYHPAGMASHGFNLPNAIPSVSTVLKEGVNAFLPAGVKPPPSTNNFDALRQLAVNPLQSAFSATIKDPAVSPLPFPQEKESLEEKVRKQFSEVEQQLTPEQKKTKSIYETIEGIIPNEITIPTNTETSPSLSLTNNLVNTQSPSTLSTINFINNEHKMPMNEIKMKNNLISHSGFPLKESSKFSPFSPGFEDAKTVTSAFPILDINQKKDELHSPITTGTPLTTLPAPESFLNKYINKAKYNTISHTTKEPIYKYKENFYMTLGTIDPVLDMFIDKRTKSSQDKYQSTLNPLAASTEIPKPPPTFDYRDFITENAQKEKPPPVFNFKEFITKNAQDPIQQVENAPLALEYDDLVTENTQDSLQPDLLNPFGLKPLPRPPKVEIPLLLSGKQLLSTIEKQKLPMTDFHSESSTSEAIVVSLESNTKPKVLESNTSVFKDESIATRNNMIRKNISQVLVPAPPNFVNFETQIMKNSHTESNIYDLKFHSSNKTTKEVSTNFDVIPNTNLKEVPIDVSWESPATYGIATTATTDEVQRTKPAVHSHKSLNHFHMPRNITSTESTLKMPTHNNQPLFDMYNGSNFLISKISNNNKITFLANRNEKQFNPPDNNSHKTESSFLPSDIYLKNNINSNQQAGLKLPLSEPYSESINQIQKEVYTENQFSNGSPKTTLKSLHYKNPTKNINKNRQPFILKPQPLHYSTIPNLKLFPSKYQTEWFSSTSQPEHKINPDAPYFSLFQNSSGKKDIAAAQEITNNKLHLKNKSKFVPLQEAPPIPKIKSTTPENVEKHQTSKPSFFNKNPTYTPHTRFLRNEHMLNKHNFHKYNKPTFSLYVHKSNRHNYVNHRPQQPVRNHEWFSKPEKEYRTYNKREKFNKNLAQARSIHLDKDMFIQATEIINNPKWKPNKSQKNGNHNNTAENHEIKSHTEVDSIRNKMPEENHTIINTSKPKISKTIPVSEKISKMVIKVAGFKKH